MFRLTAFALCLITTVSRGLPVKDEFQELILKGDHTAAITLQEMLKSESPGNINKWLRTCVRYQRHSRSKYWDLPLRVAIVKGCFEVVEVLLKYGDNPEAVSDDFQNTALHLAAGQGQHNIVQLLLKNKASVDPQNKYGLTPFVYAVRNNDVKMMEILYQQGAKIPQYLNKEKGQTLLAEVMRDKKLEAASWLVNHGLAAVPTESEQHFYERYSHSQEASLAALFALLKIAFVRKSE